MILPSRLLVPTTHTTGFFECPAEPLSTWLCEWPLGRYAHWSVSEAAAPTLRDLIQLVATITPEPDETMPEARHLLIPMGDWTAYLNDRLGGTDVGLLPLAVAKDFGRRAVVADAVADSETTLDATSFALYDPDASAHPYNLRRLVTVADQGRRWTFTQHGEVLPFEEPERYRSRRVRDRFTVDMLERYLFALGIPIDEEPEPRGLLIEYAGPRSRVPRREAVVESAPVVVAGRGLTADEALDVVEQCRQQGRRLVRLEAFDPDERGDQHDAEDDEESDARIIVDISALDASPKATARIAREHLSGHQGASLVWVVHAAREA